MILFRSLAFRLIAIVAGVLVCARPVCAASPPVWQPYREPTAPLPVVQQTVPAQYVFAAPTSDVPTEVYPAEVYVDAFTDVELDQLSDACCGDSYYSAEPFVDPILGAPVNDSLLAFPRQPAALELLPGDLIWHSYWAGAKEPRTSGAIFRETSGNLSLLDVSLGGRVSILRMGHRNQHGRPLGWELQIEGAAQLRLNLDQNFDFDSADFRFGIPLIYAPHEQLHWKFAYYHLSSHIGDEFLVRDPGFMRINFSRDVFVLGTSYFPLPAWRWYAEAGWAFYDDEGSDPWEFQFGLDFAQPGPTGGRGTPFFALNGHLREQVDFGGNLVAQAGWLWRGRTGRVLRTGLHYYNGKSSQYEFFNEFEQQIGVGLWQDY